MNLKVLTDMELVIQIQIVGDKENAMISIPNVLEIAIVKNHKIKRSKIVKYRKINFVCQVLNVQEQNYVHLMQRALVTLFVIIMHNYLKIATCFNI